MTARPSSYLNWISAGTPGYMQTPSSGQATTGWVANEKPPFEYANWLQYMADQWIKYLDGLVAGGAGTATASPTVLVTTGTVVIGSTTLSGLASMVGVGVGERVTGLGIPADTYVAAILSGTSARLSAKATSNQAGTAVTFAHWYAAGSTVQVQLDQVDAAASGNRRTPTVSVTAAGTVAIGATGADPDGAVYFADSNVSPIEFQLPAYAPPGFSFTVVDVGGIASMAPFNVLPAASEKIAGVSVTFLCNADYAAWTFISDGLNWWVK